MTTIRFGTDGWRAVIAEDFTFHNVARVAQALASQWTAHPEAGTRKSVVIGYDRRFHSDQFARLTAEVFAGNGFEVVLTPAPTPTPAVSYGVRERGAVGGVMITASHNPASFNGFKIKAWFGGSAGPELCKQVEQNVDTAPIRTTPFDQALRSKQIRIADVRASHFRAIKKLVDYKLIASKPIKFAHDALFGVGAGCYEELLAGSKCKVTTLNGTHDPSFGGINPEPIEKNYGPSRAYLSRHPHDVCLVTDGDADRVGAMDGRGNALSTHQVICLLLNHFVVRRRGQGRVVKAITTTSMVDKMCQAHGLPLVETGVGFKYIASEMLKGGVLLGFEESGGIGFPNHIPERDGILAGLMLLEVLAVEGKSIPALLKQLEKLYGPHRYHRIDTHFPLERRADLMEFCKSKPPTRLLGSPVVNVASADGVKYTAANGAWLMLRGSGTEPTLRIYAEATSEEDARKLTAAGVAITRKVLSAR